MEWENRAFANAAGAMCKKVRVFSDVGETSGGWWYRVAFGDEMLYGDEKMNEWCVTRDYSVVECSNLVKEADLTSVSSLQAFSLLPFGVTRSKISFKSFPLCELWFGTCTASFRCIVAETEYTQYIWFWKQSIQSVSQRKYTPTFHHNYLPQRPTYKHW